MRKQYLQKMESMNEVQIAMSLLGNKHLRKYTKVAFNSRKQTYNVNNFWLNTLVNVTKEQFNYISNKLNLTNC